MAEPAARSYRYEGPAEYHAAVGQAMAYLGYAGGHEPLPAGAAVTVSEKNGHLHLSAAFYRSEGIWRSAAALPDRNGAAAALRAVLLHWHQRCFRSGINPWGTLTGVRPLKLVCHLLEQYGEDETVLQILARRYQLPEQTAAPLVAMARRQLPYIRCPRQEAALYIGIPYCPSHCLYCSFPSRLAGSEDPAFWEVFVTALERDLADIYRLCRDYGLTVASVYIGGGTPTCLPLAAQDRLLRAVARYFLPVREWTVEAGRPDTAGRDVLQLLRGYGVNRISVNPQTMQQRLLDLLGRRHRTEDIYTMFEQCRKLGFSVINMDFIAGLPAQSVADMEENMEIVCQLHPENVTIHTLALKKRAPLFHHPLKERIPDGKTAAAMLACCRESLQQNGYVPYYLYRQKYMAASLANTGYALPGTESVYNIQMMEERQTILSAGPGGATKFPAADGHSLEKVYMPKDPAAYVAALPEKMAQRRRLCAGIYGGDDT